MLITSISHFEQCEAIREYCPDADRVMEAISNSRSTVTIRKKLYLNVTRSPHRAFTLHSTKRWLSAWCRSTRAKILKLTSNSSAALSAKWQTPTKISQFNSAKPQIVCTQFPTKFFSLWCFDRSPPGTEIQLAPSPSQACLKLTFWRHKKKWSTLPNTNSQKL